MASGKVTLTAQRTVTLSSRRAGAHRRAVTTYSGQFMVSEYARLLHVADQHAEAHDPARRSNAADRAWRVLGDACGYTSDSWPVVRALERLPKNLMMVREGSDVAQWMHLAECDAQLVALVRFAVGLDFSTTQVEDARRKPPHIRGINQQREGFSGMTVEHWFESALKEGATADLLATVARGWPDVHVPAGGSPDPELELERMGNALKELS